MGDTAVEADERFLLRLANPVGAAIADGEGVATIRNNDSATRPARQTGPLFGPAAGAAITAPPLLSWRPAYGKPSKPRYGKMLGQKSFRIVAKKR